jgi:5-methylcytosine-specific restriction endonuclease McrA
VENNTPPPCPKCGGERYRYKTKTQWSIRCRTCLAAKARERYWKNPAADNARSRAWHAANRERHAELTRAWHEAHPGYREAANRGYYWANREAEIARSLAYTKAHPEVDSAIKQRRRARKIAALCKHGADCVTASFLAEIRAGTCRYCGDPAQEADHFYPLARGGLHCVENIVPACKPCNNSKWAHDPLEWMQKRGLALT